MNVFLDTNVLVAGVIKTHSNHERAFSVLEKIRGGADTGFVSAHSLAEMYSILTKLPPPFRHSPEVALFSIEENVIKFFETVSLTSRDYKELLREAARAQILGGTIHDAVLMKCAAKAGVNKILTFNLRHFQAIAAPALLPFVASP